MHATDDLRDQPLFMAQWDLVGQGLGAPLHRLWAELFDVGFGPPDRAPLGAYSWQRFPDADGSDAVTFQSWPDFAAQQVAVDVLQSDIARCGGPTAIRRIAELAALHGAVVVPHCWKTGLNAAAARHFQAAT